MKNVTLEKLMERARDKADMKYSSFVQDPELIDLINESASELYDMLIKAHGSDYYVSTTPYEFSFTGQESEDLPDDFYKLVGVDAQIGGSYTPVEPFMFNDRNRQDYGYQFFRYRITGNKILFTKGGTSPSKVRIWYIPAMEDLSSPSDELDGVNGFESYIVTDVAIKMLIKEESDTRQLENERLKIVKRIETIAINRDMARPQEIQNVTRGSWKWQI